MTHPLNKKISTIKANEIYPIAMEEVKKFIGTTEAYTTLPYFGSHVSLEDLAMDAVEKVVRANPMYITKTYVRISARCVCIDKLKSKKLHQIAIKPFDDEEFARLEDTIIGDIHDTIGDLESELLSTYTDLQKDIYKELMSNKMYIEIAETLNISLRTLERQVQEMKWIAEYLTTGIDPDHNAHSLLF